MAKASKAAWVTETPGIVLCTPTTTPRLDQTVVQGPRSTADDSRC